MLTDYILILISFVPILTDLRCLFDNEQLNERLHVRPLRSSNDGDGDDGDGRDDRLSHRRDRSGDRAAPQNVSPPIIYQSSDMYDEMMSSPGVYTCIL